MDQSCESAIKRTGLESSAGNVLKLIRDKLAAHSRYIRERGEDMPEIRDWRWGDRGGAPK